MAIFVLGCFTFLIGVAMMRNQQMDMLLKSQDHKMWLSVMQPQPSGYVNSFGVIPLFTWMLSHGYEMSSSDAVKTFGQKAAQRAQWAKSIMLAGIVLLVVGFFAALFYAR